MKKKLFIHIGGHKTGSTAVQATLFRSRALLKESGILFPNAGLKGNAHQNWAKSLGIPPKNSQNIEQFRQLESQLTTDLEGNNNITSVVLSSEEFEYCNDLKLLKGLQIQYDTKIILYIRKQDLCLESIYNQNVRQIDIRYTGSIYQLALKINFYHRLNYRRKLTIWERLFGKENIIVRPYNTNLVDNDIRIDFLNLLGLTSPQDFLSTSETKHDRNASMHVAALPYITRINLLAISAAARADLLIDISNSVPKINNGRLMKEEDAKSFYQSFTSSNLYIFKHYLDLDIDVFEANNNVNSHVYIDHDDINVDLLIDTLKQHQIGIPIINEVLKSK
jgi:hypothetical protein